MEPYRTHPHVGNDVDPLRIKSRPDTHEPDETSSDPPHWWDQRDSWELLHALLPGNRLT